MQLGAWYPFFRGHAHLETARREPWLFGEETTGRIRSAIRSRYALLPYFYTLFRHANLTGLPGNRLRCCCSNSGLAGFIWLHVPLTEILRRVLLCVVDHTPSGCVGFDGDRAAGVAPPVVRVPGAARNFRDSGPVHGGPRSAGGTGGAAGRLQPHSAAALSCHLVQCSHRCVSCMPLLHATCCMRLHHVFPQVEQAQESNTFLERSLLDSNCSSDPSALDICIFRAPPDANLGVRYLKTTSLTYIFLHRIQSLSVSLQSPSLLVPFAPMSCLLSKLRLCGYVLGHQQDSFGPDAHDRCDLLAHDYLAVSDTYFICCYQTRLLSNCRANQEGR